MPRSCITLSSFSCLTVSDTGVGISPDIDIKNSSSMGLQLVNLLAKQLDGSIEVKIDKGTSFSLLYPQETPLSDNLSGHKKIPDNV